MPAVPGAGPCIGRPGAMRNRPSKCPPAGSPIAVGRANPAPAPSQVSIYQRGRRPSVRPLCENPTKMKNTPPTVHLSNSARCLGSAPDVRPVLPPARAAACTVPGMSRPHPPPPPPRVYSPLIPFLGARVSRADRRSRPPGPLRPNPGGVHTRPGTRLQTWPATWSFAAHQWGGRSRKQSNSAHPHCVSGRLPHVRQFHNTAIENFKRLG